MSRIGNRPIQVSGLSVKVENNTLIIGKGNTFVELKINEGLKIDISDGYLNVVPTNKSSHQYQGLLRTLINNTVNGFKSNFSIDLDLVGVGYKVEKKDSKLIFSLGYSHPVEYLLPDGIDCTIEKVQKQIQQYQTTLTIKGADKEKVGQVAANLVNLRVPDAYKGKGIRYAGRPMLLKPGKSGAKGGKK
jgi:large subunit ribosomal protein L6